MDNMTVKNGTKILIYSQVYVVEAVLYKCVYAKHAPSCTDYDYTEDEIIKKYKIEFIN